MRFESDKLMIVFPELYMALLSLPPAPFDKFDYRAGVGEGRVGMLDGEGEWASEREARKNIISTQHGGSHSTLSLSLQAVSADRHHVWLVQSIEPAALGWVRTVKADHFVSGGTSLNSQILLCCFHELKTMYSRHLESYQAVSTAHSQLGGRCVAC